MGWSSGSSLAAEVWHIVQRHIPKGRKRKNAAIAIVNAFEYHDCDTLQEAEILWKDAGLEEVEEE